MPQATLTHIENLRRWRAPHVRDVTLAGLAERVDRTVVRPHKQLGSISVLWRELLPPELLVRTTLASFINGTLTVEAADSAALYQLDRLLRSGLERTLKATCKAPLRRIKFAVAGRSRP